MVQPINSVSLLLIYFAWIELLILFIHVGIVNSCEYLQVIEHSTLGTMYFQQIPLDAPELVKYQVQETGRPSYVSIESNGRFTEKLYLIHVSDSFSGEGRWVFIKDLTLLASGSTSLSMNLEQQGIVGYIRSWAILPYLYRSSQDVIPTNHWYFLDAHEHLYEQDSSFTISCFNDVDKTIFIQAEFSINPRIDGYYVERFITSSVEEEEETSRTVYTQIKFMENDRQLYLYRLQMDTYSAKWLIGFEYGVDSAYAFCEDSTEQAITIHNVWNILDHFSWRKDYSLQILSVLKLTETYDYFSPTSQDLPEILRQVRSILPYSQTVPESLSLESPTEALYTLRNEVKLPMIGLGTGGIYLEESYEIFSQAIEMGYRLFDLAREYQNEGIMGKVIQKMKSTITRDQLFLETKVWPTELGFLPTTNAIINSLQELQTSYLDLYLIHWPECNWEIDWMHCETTIDPKGTWRESWLALEKAYAEGRIMSIGFSNANLPLLEALSQFATILPHVIQNWSEIGRLDEEVRQWCEQSHCIYQPYASIRNLRFQSIPLQQQIEQIARNHNVTSQEVNLRFFLQTGASIIPRSSHSDHLRMNLRNTLQWSLTDQEMIELGWKWSSHASVLSASYKSTTKTIKEL